MSLSYYKKYEKEIKKRTGELKKAYREGNHFKTICYLRYLTNLYYQINYKMTEDVFEDITQKVSKDLLGSTVIKSSNKKTVIFYDGFGLASRGLANIYVEALDKLGYDVIWILYEYAQDALKIKEKYKNRQHVLVEIIPKVSMLERMKYLQKVIENIAPEYIFVYTMPDDVAGIGVMSTIRGDVTRYLIDLTDHAFWLGKCAADYIVGFRNYGFNIAVKYRKIEESKVLILPFYPERRDDCEFVGLPFDDEKHPFIFSGGSLYKIEGEHEYEEIVTNILDTYPELYFVYAGNGNSAKLNTIKQQYPNRFFQIQERRDLTQIMRRAKFYLGTYPIGGGLMNQYALQSGCIMLQLCNDKGGLTDPKSYLLKPDEVNCVFYNKQDMLAEIDNLMNDSEYYNNARMQLTEQVISEESFVRQLELILSTNTTEFTPFVEEINLDVFLQSYKARATYEQFCDIIYNSHNQWIWKKHPLILRRKRK